MKSSLILFFYFLWFLWFVSCSGERELSPAVVEQFFDFEEGVYGWQFGYAEVPEFADGGKDLTPDYEIVLGRENLPGSVQDYALALGIKNYSDDAFLFVFRRFSLEEGIRRQTEYLIQVEFELVSNVCSGGFGVGGSAGSSNHLVFGAIGFDPETYLVNGGGENYWVTNFKPPGNQAGENLLEIPGGMANGIPCGGTGADDYQRVSKIGVLPWTVNSGLEGELWVIIGFDSGFEGVMKFYFDNIRVKLTPKRLSNSFLFSLYNFVV